MSETRLSFPLTAPVPLRSLRPLPAMSRLICMWEVPLDSDRYLRTITCSKSKGSSALVGYAAVDAPSEWLDPFANYLTCDPSGGNSGDTSIDIFGLNN